MAYITYIDTFAITSMVYFDVAVAHQPQPHALGPVAMEGPPVHGDGVSRGPTEGPQHHFESLYGYTSTV